MVPTRPCTFSGCDRPSQPDSDKCYSHRTRKQCCVVGCTNVVYARQLCVRHGGKKQCLVDGCLASAQGGELCAAHGGEAIKRFCRVEGCERQSHAKRLCVHHGGGRLCQYSGCSHHARSGGFCHKHKFARQTSPVHIKMQPPTPKLSPPQPIARPSIAPVTASKYKEWWSLTQNILQQEYPWLKREPPVNPAPPTLDPQVCLQMTQAVLMTPAMRRLFSEHPVVAPALQRLVDKAVETDVGNLAELLAEPKAPEVTHPSDDLLDGGLDQLLHHLPLPHPPRSPPHVTDPLEEFTSTSFLHDLTDFSH
ncbi:hypothetical protein AC1031_018362 [Aphanomyces cochlioides]|nr:hypothetical protein AC1031_018362 [Aphanomyces cochlioides]